jgi:hypothetical protein
MTLKEISVKKFIHLKDIIEAKHFDTEIDKEIALLVCLTGKPEDFFLNLNMSQLKEWTRQTDFLSLEEIDGKPEKFIKANGNIYAPVYDFSALTAGQLVDITHFLKEPENLIFNLPKILASFCVPTKRTLTGRKKLKYLDVPHHKVAEDMEAASILDAYEIAVFFWTVLKSFLETTGDCLVKKMIATKTAKGEKITPTETKALLTILSAYGDGITARKKSPSLNA